MSELIRLLPVDERLALFQAAGRSLGIGAAYVEKDYWALEVLRSLSTPYTSDSEPDVRVTPVFKGGTSLSKAFGLIERFSDDIDVFLITDHVVSKNAQSKQFLKPITERVKRDLTLGASKDSHLETSDNFKRNTRFYYPETTEEGAHSRGVLLEMSFRNEDSTLPGLQQKTLRSFVSEHLAADAEDFTDASDFDVAVLSPARTLLEKLCAVVGIRDDWKAGNVGPLAKGARHFYDICLLLRDEKVREELKSIDVPAICEIIHTITKANSFTTGVRPTDGFGAHALFSDREDFFRAATAQYEDIRPLVYGTLPTFLECLEEVASRRDSL